MDNGLILITASSHGQELRVAIEESLGAPVDLVSTFAEAMETIFTTRYRAVIIDEGLADLELMDAKRLLDRLTDELPIFVKLAISGVPRCIQQVQSALRRFEREQRTALYSVTVQLRDSLTSVLVCSQLARKVPGLPPGATERIDSIIEAAEKLQALISETNSTPLAPKEPGSCQ